MNDENFMPGWRGDSDPAEWGVWVHCGYCNRRMRIIAYGVTGQQHTPASLARDKERADGLAFHARSGAADPYVEREPVCPVHGRLGPQSKIDEAVAQFWNNSRQRITIRLRRVR